MARTRIVLVVLAASLVACGPSVRDSECGRFADWSNGIGTEIERRVPTSRLSGEPTHAERAAWFRDRARAMREVAAEPPPFTDARVLGLAQRLLATYGPQADVLDAEATAWEAGDGAGVRAAQVREGEAQSARTPIMDEWMSHCRD